MAESNHPTSGAARNNPAAASAGNPRPNVDETPSPSVDRHLAIHIGPEERGTKIDLSQRHRASRHMEPLVFSTDRNFAHSEATRKRPRMLPWLSASAVAFHPRGS